MQIDLPENQRRATIKDWQAVAEIIAEAFKDDPVNRYLFGTETGIRSAMRVLARRIYVPAGESFLIEGCGATMWLPPEAKPKFGFLAQLAFAMGQMRHGKKGAMKRAMHMGALMDQHHPKDPHMYLFTIGTTAAARGKGTGKALMRPMLEACDREGLPVYLENSNPANHGFYTAHGFEKITDFEIGPDGPLMAPMWRAAR